MGVKRQTIVIIHRTTPMGVVLCYNIRSLMKQIPAFTNTRHLAKEPTTGSRKRGSKLPWLKAWLSLRERRRGMQLFGYNCLVRLSALEAVLIL